MKMKLIEGSDKKATVLMEQNHAGHEKFQRTLTEAKIKEAAERYGIKNWKEVLDMGAQDFSIKQFREGAYKAAKMKMMEAQAELAYGQLLRAGVQSTFNDIYNAVEVTYTAAVRETSSNKRQEFYAPLERAGFPKRVLNGDSFPETNFKGLDIEMINAKYGVMLSFERELIDDDQTGQIVARAQQLGENARIHEEAYVWARLMNDTTASLDGEPLPVSSTYATPYSSSGIHAGGYGVNATTAARLSQTQIQAGWILAKKMLDQSGRPIVVTPKILAVSPQDVFFAEVLLNSQVNPSMSSTQTADIGKVGGIGSINPIKSLVGVISSRFIRDYGALLIDPGKGFNFQRRDPQEVIQENPQSGPAFSQEVFRYRLRSRWEADFIDPKFMINLNTSFSST
jgi:Mu-like prophage major head subunit gpT